MQPIIDPNVKRRGNLKKKNYVETFLMYGRGSICMQETLFIVAVFSIQKYLMQ